MCKESTVIFKGYAVRWGWKKWKWVFQFLEQASLIKIDNIVISRFCGEPPFVWRELHSCPSQGGDRCLGRILCSCVFSWHSGLVESVYHALMVLWGVEYFSFSFIQGLSLGTVSLLLSFSWNYLGLPHFPIWLGTSRLPAKADFITARSKLMLWISQRPWDEVKHVLKIQYSYEVTGKNKFKPFYTHIVEKINKSCNSKWGYRAIGIFFSRECELKSSLALSGKIEVVAQPYWSIYRCLSQKVYRMWGEMFIAALFVIVNLLKWPKCLLTGEWIHNLWCAHRMEYTTELTRQHGYTSRT